VSEGQRDGIPRGAFAPKNINKIGGIFHRGMTLLFTKIQQPVNIWPNFVGKLEDDLNSKVNGRRPPFFVEKWEKSSIYFAILKTASVFWQNGRWPHFLNNIEDNLNFYIQNGRLPSF
jgi:hypothetical protein